MKRPDPQPPLVVRMKGCIPCLSILYGRSDDLRLLVASGSLLEERGRMFWITAGHVLDSIERLHADGCIRVARWQDSVHPAIPVDVGAFQKMSRDVNGVDFGIVELPWNVAAALRAGPAFKAFGLDRCIKTSDLERLAQKGGANSYVLGYPQEWSRLDVGATQSGSRRAVTVTVRPVEIPLSAVTRESVEGDGAVTPDGFWIKHCYFAQIPEAHMSKDDPLLTIGGVSGGPVVVVQGDECMLLGIQTAWISKSRIVRILPIDFVWRVIDDYIKWLERGEGNAQPL